MHCPTLEVLQTPFWSFVFLVQFLVICTHWGGGKDRHKKGPSHVFFWATWTADSKYQTAHLVCSLVDLFLHRKRFRERAPPSASSLHLLAIPRPLHYHGTLLSQILFCFLRLLALSLLTFCVFWVSSNGVSKWAVSVFLDCRIMCCG